MHRRTKEVETYSKGRFECLATAANREPHINVTQ